MSTRPIAHCALLLLPGASPLALGAVLSALHGANELLDGECTYAAHLLSADGSVVGTAGGASLVTTAMDWKRTWAAAFVIGADTDDLAHDDAIVKPLGQLGAGACAIAGIGTGVALLARAGLFDRQRACAPWRIAEGLALAFPSVVWTTSLWEISTDGRRLSAAAGTASLDLLIAWLGRSHGERIAQDLPPLLGLERGRLGDERQPRSSARGAVASLKLKEALALMEANLAEPLGTEEIATLSGVSKRQLERLFKQHLDTLPSKHYLELRLQRARRLLLHSAQSILQIGLSCGFSSGPHFSNAYRVRFGYTPRDERAARTQAWRPTAPKPEGGAS